MITIDIEFTTKTVMGLSEAKVYKSEYGGYGEHMEDMVKWVMKAIKHDNVIRPMITFSYWDDNKQHEVGTSRIIYDYAQKQEVVRWDDRGNVIEHIKGVQVDARLIKRLYNENVARLEATESVAV